MDAPFPPSLHPQPRHQLSFSTGESSERGVVVVEKSANTIKFQTESSTVLARAPIRRVSQGRKLQLFLLALAFHLSGPHHN